MPGSYSTLRERIDNYLPNLVSSAAGPGILFPRPKIRQQIQVIDRGIPRR